jgi:two-component system, chemotaxis family, chemotaxis protein CheY
MINNCSSILLVDDSCAIRSIVRKLLTQLGYTEIDEAVDGSAALEKIRNKHFALVISDWNMEPMTGQLLLEQVRASKQFARLPFIMMTAQSSVEKLVQARHAGVSCFINKPFAADALAAKIAQINAQQRPAAVA